MADFATGETPREHSPRLLQRVYKVIQRLKSSRRTGQVCANRFFTLEPTVADDRLWPIRAIRERLKSTPMCRSQLCVGCFEKRRQPCRAGRQKLAELYIVTASAGTA